MANLQALLTDPHQCEAFVQAVVGGSERRNPVELNHGITSALQSQELICQEPMPFVLYDFSHESASFASREESVDPKRLDELLRQEPMPFAVYDFSSDR